MSYSFFPKLDCQLAAVKNGQRGYFYDAGLNILLLGKIEDYKLKAKVVHDGSDYENGRFFCAFNVGYKYRDWDLSNIIFIPQNINTLEGFLKFIKPLNFDQIKKYYKGKRIINETIK